MIAPVFVVDEETPVDEVAPPLFIAKKSLDEDGIIIPNFPFFPDIVLREFQSTFNTNKSIPAIEQVQAITESIAWVNDDLLNPASNNGSVSWVNEQQSAGVSCLDDVPSRLDSLKVSEKKTAYLTAIYAKAKSILISRFPDTDSSKQGTAAAAVDFQTGLEKQSAAYEVTAREAIRQIMNISHFTIELI